MKFDKKVDRALQNPVERQSEISENFIYLVDTNQPRFKKLVEDFERVMVDNNMLALFSRNRRLQKTYKVGYNELAGIAYGKWKPDIEKHGQYSQEFEKSKRATGAEFDRENYMNMAYETLRDTNGFFNFLRKLRKVVNLADEANKIGRDDEWNVVWYTLHPELNKG